MGCWPLRHAQGQVVKGAPPAVVAQPLLVVQGHAHEPAPGPLHGDQLGHMRRCTCRLLGGRCREALLIVDPTCLTAACF